MNATDNAVARRVFVPDGTDLFATLNITNSRIEQMRRIYSRLRFRDNFIVRVIEINNLFRVYLHIKTCILCRNNY